MKPHWGIHISKKIETKLLRGYFSPVSNVRTRGHKLIGRKGISKIPKQRTSPQQIHAAVFVDARRRSATTWFTKGQDNYLLLGANPASPSAAGRHWPSACLHFAFVWPRRSHTAASGEPCVRKRWEHWLGVFKLLPLLQSEGRCVSNHK